MIKRLSRRNSACFMICRMQQSMKSVNALTARDSMQHHMGNRAGRENDGRNAGTPMIQTMHDDERAAYGLQPSGAGIQQQSSAGHSGKKQQTLEIPCMMPPSKTYKARQM